MPETAAPIDAVFFDIGNVLLRFDPKAVAAKMAWQLRRHPLKLAQYLWKTKTVDAIERGQMSAEQLYAIFRDEFGYRGSFAQFKDFWCDHFTLDRVNFGLLQRLARAKRVYLLSNTNALHYEYIQRRYAFPRHVHGAILSYELGLRKPEPAIYAAAVKLAGVEPARCLFIDDLEENVAAARRFGLQVIHHKKGHDLRRALAELGLVE